MSTPVGPYVPAIRFGDMVVISGQLGLAVNPDGSSSLVSGGTAEQLDQVLTNVASVLATESARIDQVVKATMFLADMDDFPLVNEVWVRHFGSHRPTRSTIGVAALPLGGRVEVEVWAHAPLEG